MVLLEKTKQNKGLEMINVNKETLEKWLDILNYWLDDIQELGERFDSMHKMYVEYDKMIDEMYNLTKENKMKNALKFETKKKIVLEKGFCSWEKDVVESWYDIESEDDDMSTPYLLQRVEDDTGIDQDDILEVMRKFSEKYDEIFGDENNKENKKD